MLRINIIQARKEHAKLIWDWRNDFSTRKMSLSDKMISWEDHISWYKKTLTDEYKKVYLGEYLSFLIGVIRFDRSHEIKDCYNISITVDPKQRGKGLGKSLLLIGLKEFLDSHENCSQVQAIVKYHNKFSKKLFESCGFKVKSEDIQISTYALSRQSFNELRGKATFNY